MTGWLVPLDIPVDIDRAEAQRRALDELARAKYGGVPDVVEDALRRFLEFLEDISSFLSGLGGAGGGGVGPGFGIAVLVLLVAMSALLAYVAAVQVLLYLDLRMRREALDLALRFDCVPVPQPAAPPAPPLFPPGWRPPALPSPPAPPPAGGHRP